MTVPAASSEGQPQAGLRGALRRAEDIFNLLILSVMAVLPLIEIVGRKLGGHTLPGAAQYVSMLTLWIGFTGAMLAARDKRHLSLTSGLDIFKGPAAVVAKVLAIVVAAAVTATLSYGAWITVDAERASTQVIPGGVPVWVTQLAMPLGYAFVAWRLIAVAFPKLAARAGVLIAVAGLLAVAYFGDYELAEKLLWPAIGVVALATIAGAPIYVALGGAALLLFWADDTPVASVAAETVRQIKNPTMPTIPLFTFAGYILAESNASSRLVRVVRGLVGWMPGGVAIMTAVVCAFFTTFTGASGVTILALGGLLYPMLVREGYPDRFSIGLLTASGSIGLLFPPSLPVIFYGVIAHVPVDRMFVAGLLPGAVLVAALALFGVVVGVKSEAKRTAFDPKEALQALWIAKWELALPIIAVGGIVLDGRGESIACPFLMNTFIGCLLAVCWSFASRFWIVFVFSWPRDHHEEHRHVPGRSCAPRI